MTALIKVNRSKAEILCGVRYQKTSDDLVTIVCWPQRGVAYLASITNDPCELGHLSCATEDGGACSNEVFALLGEPE